MTLLSFETLMRYVDGELSDRECAEIEALLPTDLSARQTIADLRAQRVELVNEFRPKHADMPRPETLVAIDRAFEARRSQDDRRNIVRRWVLPLAASVMIALVAGIVGCVVGTRQVDSAVGQVIAAYARDDTFTAQARAKALEHLGSGEVARWSNADSGTVGSIMPLRTFRIANGQWCREFEQVIKSKTGDDRSTGVACRQLDGKWRLALERPRIL